MQKRSLRIFALVVVVLALAFPFLLALEKLHESDTFWHLKTGEWILAHGSIPRADTYSSTVPGKPWLDWEWLFQAGLCLVFKVGGFNALVLLKSFLVGLTGLLVYQASRRNEAGPLLAATVVMLASVASQDRLEMRPDLVFVLFAAASMAILEAARRGQRTWLWCLPVVQIVWVNCHASFLLGPCLVGAYAVGDSVSRVTSRNDADRSPGAPGLPWIVLLLVCAVSLLNPYGVSLIGHAVSQTRAASPAGAIGEWQPTLDLLLTQPRWALRAFWWLFWSTPILLVARLVMAGRRFPWAHALIVAGMSLLALRANRFTAVYAVVTAPILAGAAAQVFKKMGRVVDRPVVCWAATGIVGSMAVFLMVVVVTDRWSTAEDREARFGWGVDESTVPFRALDFLNGLSPSLGLFNTFPSGGPLIWASVPPWKVFSDGRANLYGREFVDQYRAAMRDPARWESWMRERDLSVVFVQYGTADDSVLLDHLAHSAEWSMVYFDQAACLFARSGKVSQQVPWDEPEPVWKYAVVVANRVARGDQNRWGRAMATMGNFLMVCGRVEAADRLFQEAVAVNPRISEAWMNLGMIERNRGHLDRAKEMADRLLEQNPYYYPARLMRAEIVAAQGNLGAAIAEVDAVLRRVPHSAQAWFKRAQLAAQQGNRDQSIRALRRVTAEGVEDPTVYWFLARLLARENRQEEAVKAYEDCLRVWVGPIEKKTQVEAELQKLRGVKPLK